MTDTDPCFLSVAEAVSVIAGKPLSPVELTRAYLDRIKRLNGNRHPTYMRPFNLTGQPALSVCNGFDKAGLPLSLQIVGRPFDEATVLRIGNAYERATSWRERRPQLP